MVLRTTLPSMVTNAIYLSIYYSMLSAKGRDRLGGREAVTGIGADVAGGEGAKFCADMEMEGEEGANAAAAGARLPPR